MLTNVIIPMAGAGNRFRAEGFSLPKPFIDVGGCMMVERVLEGLHCPNAHYTLIIQRCFRENHAELLHRLEERFHVAFVCVERLTQGACCTALAAHRLINNELPVVFADSDNIFAPGVFAHFVEESLARHLDGCLLTFPSSEPCFSYAAVDEQGFVTATREKEPISTHAIAGAYLFARGRDFVHSALQPLIYGERSKGEFYMSAVYNYAVSLGLHIGIFEIQANDCSCIGTPVLLGNFLNNASLEEIKG